MCYNIKCENFLVYQQNVTLTLLLLLQCTDSMWRNEIIMHQLISETEQWPTLSRAACGPREYTRTQSNKHVDKFLI